MKIIVLLLFVLIPAYGRDNVEWTKLLDAIAQVESSGGKRMVNERELAYGWYQMRPLARKDANDHVGTNYAPTHLFDRRFANRLFAAYVHKYRRKWSTTDEVIHLWHLGPNWRNRLHLDRGYLEKVKKALQEREL